MVQQLARAELEDLYNGMLVIVCLVSPVESPLFFLVFSPFHYKDSAGHCHIYQYLSTPLIIEYHNAQGEWCKVSRQEGSRMLTIYWQDLKHFCHDIVRNGLLSDNGEVCGKSFVRMGDLTRHRKIHTGIMYVHEYVLFICF